MGGSSGIGAAIADRLATPAPPTPAVTARMLRPEDVAEAAMFMLSLPARAWVPELTILPTALQALGKTSQPNPELPGG
jgi:hypothetical protein